MKKMLKESFIPVLLVIMGIFLLVYYSHYIANIDAEEVMVIVVPAQLMKQGTDLGDVPSNDASEDEEMRQVTVLRLDKP